MMVTTIEKTGNGLAALIPSALAEEAGLEAGTPIVIKYLDGELQIRKRRRKRYDLDKLLASVPDDYDEGEWDTGPPVGNEVW